MGFAQVQLQKGPSATTPTISVTIGEVSEFIMTVTEPDGTAKDLTPYVPPAGDNPEVKTTCPPGKLLVTTGVQFNAAMYQGQDPIPVCRVATIVEADDHCDDDSVRFSTEACDFECPGIYLGELLFIKDGNIEDSYRMNIEVQASLNFRVNGPLNIAEVRLWVRDTNPEDNFLLDEVEYKDAEIIAAISRGVDTWNSTPPMMRRATYTPHNFPYRGPWIQVTVGYLMGIAAHSYLRNHLPYQAAGLSVDDKNKYQYYRQESKERIEGYRAWVREAKLQANAEQMWGSSKIFYPGCTYGGGRYHYNGFYTY